MLQTLRRAAAGSVLETRPHYRTAIGVLGVSLPPLLIISSRLQNQALENSISAYYYTSARDWFVGVLWVLGVFLFFYQYRPRQQAVARSQRQSIQSGAADAWLGKIAGASAVVVALFPTSEPSAPTQPPTIGMVHGVAAAMLFICLAFFPLLLFSQSRERRNVYLRYGWTMIALLALVVVYAFAPDGVREAIARWRPVLVLETLLIVVFGASWFHRGLELAAREREDRARAESLPLARAS
jgi:Na+/H+ antiporter NhaD/arsenite permease-like protein